MSKHRVFLLALGLLAMMGFMSSQARAETLTLSVYAGSGTGGTLLYSVVGGANMVSADIAAVNSALATATPSLAAYTFQSLGAVSDDPGASNPTGGIVQASGDLTVKPGSGESTAITVVAKEDGFVAPSPFPNGVLKDLSTANYDGIVAGGTQFSTGMYSAPSGFPIAFAGTSPGALTATGLLDDVHAALSSTMFTPFLIPYTITSLSILNVDPIAADGGSVGFTNKVFIVGVPEPASVVMMLTGMPLPLVVLGLLRRRRGAA